MSQVRSCTEWPFFFETKAVAEVVSCTVTHDKEQHFNSVWFLKTRDPKGFQLLLVLVDFLL